MSRIGWGDAYLNKLDLIRGAPNADGGALAPIQDYLNEIHARISKIEGGAPAAYIPELGKVDPKLFGIAIATVDGQLYTVGDARVPFTIQSVSKPFMYGYALQHHGRSRVLEKVGVERRVRPSTPSYSTRPPTGPLTPW